jgi:hypothetical protein
MATSSLWQRRAYWASWSDGQGYWRTGHCVRSGCVSSCGDVLTIDSCVCVCVYVERTGRRGVMGRGHGMGPDRIVR